MRAPVTTLVSLEGAASNYTSFQMGIDVWMNSRLAETIGRKKRSCELNWQIMQNKFILCQLFDDFYNKFQNAALGLHVACCESHSEDCIKASSTEVAP